MKVVNHPNRSKQTYNGWKNYETWNVALWLGNDEGLYNAARDFARQCKPLHGADAEDFVREIMPEGTPDFPAWRYRAVNWPEIASMLRELAA